MRGRREEFKELLQSSYRTLILLAFCKQGLESQAAVKRLDY